MTNDPIGRWGPYEKHRRLASDRGIIAGLVAIAALLGAAYLLAKYGLEVAP